jgi:phosphatidylserine decarboxylase
LFYYIFHQPAVKDLQTPIAPNQEPELTFISSWIVRYADAMGKFLDAPESISTDSLKTFVESPNYIINDYIQPRTGFKSSTTSSPETSNLATAPLPPFLILPS